jgi:AcrR family transcriptional regulator
MNSYHHGDLASALTAAGIEIVERDGVDRLTLRAAARSVGVSHAAPARHFPDSTAFLASIATAGYERLATELRVPAGLVDAAEAFRQSGRAYIAFALAHPHLYRATFHSSLADVSRFPRLEAASNEAFGVLVSALERAVAAGVVRDGDISMMALSTWSTVHGISTLLIDGQLAKKGYTATSNEISDQVLLTMYLGLRLPD